MYLGGVELPNGAGVKLGATQASKIMLGAVQVWVNNSVADAPTGFTASNNPTANIDFTWVLPTNQGVPACTYEIRDSTTHAVYATAGVGATTAQYVTTASSSLTFYVVGVNVVGDGAISNSASGSSYVYVGPASPVTISASTTLTAGIDFPLGKSITVCICGGGAGGGQGGSFYDAGGGGGGSGAVTSSFSYTQNDSVSVVIGAGGTPAGNGGDSSFGTLSASGGTAGGYIVGGAGGSGGGAGGGTGTPGGSFSGCGGSYSGGSSEPYFSGGGGAGGFGNGGAGVFIEVGAGGSGAGAGGSGGGATGVPGGSEEGFIGGSGSAGRCVLSWV